MSTPADIKTIGVEDIERLMKMGKKMKDDQWDDEEKWKELEQDVDLFKLAQQRGEVTDDTDQRIKLLKMVLEEMNKRCEQGDQELKGKGKRVEKMLQKTNKLMEKILEAPKND